MKHRIQAIYILNKLSSSKIVVYPKDRDLYLYPFAKLCYHPRFACNTRGPQYYAMLLYLAFDFLVTEDPKGGAMNVQMIDKEIQKCRKLFYE